MFIFPSPFLPSSPLPPCLFTFSIPLSHFLILFDCPTPSHSYPLTDRLSVGACTGGLFPRAAGLNQLQFEMKAGGGGGVRMSGIAEILCPMYSEHSLTQPPAGLLDTHILSWYLSPPRHVHEKSLKLSHKQTNKKISHSPQPGSWFPLDVTSPINIPFFFSLISYYFSFPFLMFLPQDPLLRVGLN